MLANQRAFFEAVKKNKDLFVCYLNPASVEFAEDARRQGRRRTRILQALANTADSAKSALSEGKLFSKNQTLMACLKLMRAI